MARPYPSLARGEPDPRGRLIVACDEKLVARIRKALARTPGIVEKRMFGGVAFLDALRDVNARIFDITGRPMRGWILVEPRGVAGAKLARWIERARAFVRTLPGK